MSERAPDAPEMEPKVVEEKARGGPPGAKAALSAKAAALALLQDAFAKTPIAKAKVWNPWDQVCEVGIDLVEVQGTPGLTAAPTTIPEDEAFGALGLVKKSAYLGRFRELSKTMDVDLTKDTFDRAKLLLKTGYLQWARSNWRGVTGGNCTYFAGVTIGYLSENIKLVPPGASVEQFNLEESGQGHAFVVVGRDADSKPATPATWGKDCFVVDQWYARQRVREPGRYAVKDVTDSSPFYDPAFLAFLGTGRIYRGPAYSYEDLTKLR